MTRREERGGKLQKSQSITLPVVPFLYLGIHSRITHQEDHNCKRMINKQIPTQLGNLQNNKPNTKK